MARTRFSPEQVVTKLRQMEVLMGDGKSLQQAVREAGITDATYYRWPLNSVDKCQIWVGLRPLVHGRFPANSGRSPETGSHGRNDTLVCRPWRKRA
jgi:hypothetical protein